MSDGAVLATSWLRCFGGELLHFRKNFGKLERQEGRARRNEQQERRGLEEAGWATTIEIDNIRSVAATVWKVMPPHTLTKSSTGGESPLNKRSDSLSC